MLVEVLGGLFTHVGDVVGQLLYTALGVTHFQHVLVDVQRGEDVFTHNALGDHDGVLEVVTLPWHEGHLHVLAEGEFAFLRGVTFHEDLASLHLLSFRHHGLQIHARALVGPGKLGEVVHAEVTFKRDEQVVVVHVVTDVDLVGIHKLHNAIALCAQQHTRVAGHRSLHPRTHDG